jgi:hypothetical protein
VSLIRKEEAPILGRLTRFKTKAKDWRSKSRRTNRDFYGKPIAGRHIFERDVLYVKVPENDAKVLLTTHLDDLTQEEQDLLKEYVNMMRKKVPFWAGVM